MTRPEASAILPDVISFGVQTWGTDVVALRHYWQTADDLGYARITYGDGLWGWTHDGCVLRGARLESPPIQKPGPPVWLAAMGPGALGVAARRASGREASYLTPAAFTAR